MNLWNKLCPFIAEGEPWPSRPAYRKDFFSLLLFRWTLRLPIGLGFIGFKYRLKPVGLTDNRIDLTLYFFNWDRMFRLWPQVRENQWDALRYSQIDEKIENAVEELK